jgi:beta-galactosidase/beta-glucuronidase
MRHASSGLPTPVASPSSNAVLAALLLAASAALAPVADAATWGPFNAEFPAASDGLVKHPPKGVTLAGPRGFAIGGWFKPSETAHGTALLAGVDGIGYLCTIEGKLAFCGPGAPLRTDVPLDAGVWTHVAASRDGHRIVLYANGREVARQDADGGTATAEQLAIAPRTGAAGGFAGRVAGLLAADEALDAQAVARLAAARPDEDLTVFETGSPHWPLQTRQMAGQLAPQDAWTLPKSAAAASTPVAVPAYAGPALEPRGANAWAIRAWALQSADKAPGTARQIASSGYDASRWYKATVPGTVLTTLVDRGVYPNPAHGLDNLAIPESLSRQDWWYRASFALPAAYRRGQHLFVTFKGINYASDIWVNGRRAGTTRGAFVRGSFDLGPYVNPTGENVIAVKVSPPPHPGIAHEESMTAGVGENGGVQAQDGPTFIATEGWDWIPSVRDRNTGLWQEVVLHSTGDVRVGDAHVITALAADNGQADVDIEVPVTNLSNKTVRATVRATIRDRADAATPIVVSRTLDVAPGTRTVRFAAKEFAALKIRHPRLWWPNGYGRPDLHDLDVHVLQGQALSDHARTAFGIRSVTYELSLVDHTGHLRRVEADFTKGHELGIRITDARHEALRKVAGNQWATSLRLDAEGSKAIRDLADTALSPYLVIKVNGVRIAARGGNWGMDDFMKRVDRARLEPYFRLHRDANVNIIRNWVGQNTEETFFELADEYGLMVLNDFWASTQDYNIEPQDVDLFMANALDVVRRFRNHPSIVAWFGRNEGVPQPALNEKLEALIYAEDGTRWYTGSSNRVNLQNSGPYDYQPPATYFTTHAKGFAVEVGTPSFPTLEAFEAAVPPSERWPLGDTAAYHDWHASGNGRVEPFMKALESQYGTPASLADFERKAQLMNYESHRAIFEGMNAGLWRENSGRMLWMTQPAWPSTMWQILSHDYDTHAAYYGTKHASEPVHVQLNLPDYAVDVINNPTTPLENARVAFEAYTVDGRLAGRGATTVSVAGVATSGPIDLGIAPLLAREGLLIVKLVLADGAGRTISDNVYWPAASPDRLRGLDALAAVPVAVHAAGRTEGRARKVDVTLANPSTVPLLNAKLTLTTSGGARVLPVYWSDNYVSLMPGERRTVTAEFDAASAGQGALHVAVRAWNGPQQTVTVDAPRP